MGKINPKDRIGLKFILDNSEEIEIIDYVNSRSCTVKFVSCGTIRKDANWGNIVRGKLSKINYKSVDNINIKLSTVYEQFCGDSLEIIEYINPHNCTVQFKSDNSIRKNIRFQNIENGNVLNHNTLNNPTVYNIGYFGIGEFDSTNKSYNIWKEMFRRCYDEQFKINNPTYNECIVVESWFNYQNFAQWYYQNLPKTEEKLIFNLDKDILFPGNKIYGPNTCCIIPEKLNCIFVKPSIERDLPVGVTKSPTKGKYVASLSKNQIRYNLGTFTTIEEAFKTYKIEKEKYVKEVSEEYKHLLTDDVYLALQNFKVIA